ncbi:MAG: hypothetical protein M9945_08965 [Aquamicrobium sp.]|uniref:DUF6998 domain-containing protein n=1 Tax=Aquamicrobium sp. TaxID=1872579 RepID=UPI00349E973F|nr:hypothetical protein [Aquamicrobium sp.]
MHDFKLPESIAKLVEARNGVREHYRAIMEGRGCDVALRFTFDGNLVGDLGKAVAAELFDIQIVKTKRGTGINGYAKDGKAVQIKATATGRGPSFLPTERSAYYFLFFGFDLDVETPENRRGSVLFNGPCHLVTSLLPAEFTGLKAISLAEVRKANERVGESKRLKRIDTA